MNALVSNGITAEVTINGRPVRTYPHQGKYFFESRKDSQYTITVHNSNWYRVEVVVSVDGLSVMNGELASKTDSGYIINGYDKVVIKGYRYSDDSVGAFKFTEKDSSYAADKDVEGNAGLIAIVVFAEYVDLTPPPVSVPWTYSPAPVWYSSGGCSTGTLGDNVLRGCSGSNGPLGMAGTAGCSGTNGINMGQVTANYCSVLADAVPAAHGTTWGDKVDDHVNYVSWTRSYEIYSTEILYNSRENLITMGVPVVPAKLAVAPVGFPRDHATPPRGWKG
jgi:hypothetical protein